MKLATIKSALLALPLLAMAVVPASADIYSNGPVNGQGDAWDISDGYEVSDSFTVSSPSTATGVNFSVWQFPGDTLTQVDWSIGTTVNGTDTAFATGAAVTTVSSFTNNDGYNVNNDSFVLPNVTLAPGTTYYLSLTNGANGNSDGNPIYWDENGGPSNAYISGNGYAVGTTIASFGESGGIGGGTGSQTFTIEGTAGAQAPEPGFGAIVSLIMIGLTFLTVRHRRNSVAVKE